MNHRLILAPLLVSGALLAQSGDKIDQILAELERVHHFGAVSISPDGAWVTWIEEPAAGKDRILLKPRSGQGEAVRVTAGKAGDFVESGVAWSSNSKMFAFISNAGGSQQIYAAAVGEPAKPRQLTHVTGDITDLRWSPDSRQVAFLYTEGSGAGGPLAAVPAQTGVIGSGFVNQRLEVATISGGEAHAVTSADINIYEYSWSPDGAKFAAIAAKGPADNNWWLAKLYTVDAATGKMTETYKPVAGQQIAVPRWSPDGSRIAFIGGDHER